MYTYRHADTYVYVLINILIRMNTFIFRHAYTNVYMYLSNLCHVQGKRNMIWELLDDDAALDVGMHEFQFELKAMKLGRFRV